MIRARFYANEIDPRPVVWPINHPYWISGNLGDKAVLVAYADSFEEIQTNWPDASDIQFTEVTGYEFTDRFPCPSWFTGL